MLEEQRKQYAKEMEKMKKEWEQKSSKDLEELRRSVSSKKEEPMEEVQDSQVSSQECKPLVDPQNSGSGQQEAPKRQSSTPPTQNRDEGDRISSQNREENMPMVVAITEENMGRVSRIHKGLLHNLDGTLSRTPQYETW